MDEQRLPTILYVDDEPGNLEVFGELFDEGYVVRTAVSGAEALAVLEREAVAVLVTDQRMPGMSGVELLERVAVAYPDVVAVVITAYTDTELMLGAIRAGRLHDYLIKPWSPVRLRETVRGAVEEHQRRCRLADLVRDRAALEQQLLERYDPAQVVGSEGGLRSVMETVRVAAASGSTVLIQGETGTGKELVARAIHAQSARRHRALVKVDCAALAPTLVESELFGHRRGAFTGAVKDRPGRFELADGGTVFLDEVAELTVSMQARLLRVLQEGVVERLGGGKPFELDARVIAATARDLPAAVVAGEFREDLYYRLCVVPIMVPPLRQRTEDIPALVQHFLRKHGRGNVAWEVAPTAFERLRRHDWPGNVRELENLVERAVVLGAGPRLGPQDLSPFRSTPPTGGRPRRRPSGPEVRGGRLDARQLREALRKAGGNVSHVAQALRLPRTTLHYRLRKFGLI
ncbi:MAG: sigma-54-dependent Fis family transcriptional regulator [Deltaproteobacteria bacterium]|nr:sigma-54-dependent Fis family transcriptional regulator [Deltaproteobacteria bacterium]